MSGDQPAVEVALPRGGAIRARAANLRDSGDRPGAARLLRQLRRLSELTPNEHRLLFRALRAERGDRLLERYLRRVGSQTPTRENWRRIALALWSEGKLDVLFAWSANHPDSAESAARFLVSCASVSAKHNEGAIARAILDEIARWNLQVDDIKTASDAVSRKLPPPEMTVQERSGPGPRLKPERKGKASAETSASGLSHPRHDLALAANLRTRADTCRAAGQREDAVRALRALRRVAPLTPNEHRYLFRALRQIGNDGLIDRYERIVLKDPVASSPWDKVALLLWSFGRIPQLLAHAQRHPDGEAGAKKTFQALAASSAKHKETATALALNDLLANRRPQDAGLRREVSRPDTHDTHEAIREDVEPQTEGRKQRETKSRDPFAPGSGGDPFARLAALRARLSQPYKGAMRTKIAAAFVEILNELKKTGARDLGKRTDDLQTVVALLPDQVPQLAHFFRDIGEGRRALGLYMNAPARSLNTADWIEAARFAQSQSDIAMTVEFCRRAATRGGMKGAGQAATLLADAGQIDAALTLLSDAPDEDRSTFLLSNFTIVRMLLRSERHGDAFERGLGALARLWPLDDLEIEDQNRVVSFVRLLGRAGLGSVQHRFSFEDWSAPLQPRQSALSRWVMAMIRAAVLDHDGALAELNEALRVPQPPEDVALIIPAEIALLHARQRRFGDARRALMAHRVDVEHDPYYGKLLEPVRAVTEFCPDAELYPECLIDVIMEEIAREPVVYEPDPGHIATISGSLAQGGGERQTINIIEGFTSDPRIGRQTVLVRSIENEDGFFRPVLDRLPVDTLIYGENWRDASDVADVLPQLDERPRLRTAIDLLPHATREDVIRLCRHLWEIRPQAVHVRQDLFAAALACAIAGVPTFFIHRGSLSRDAWEHSSLQAEQILRPMRHTYRRLLEHTGFFIVNNSTQGRMTDLAWIDWPDHSRFHVVHNAVDFAQLGPNAGPNFALRDELGIPRDAPVIGGVFRIVSVKRPMLWIEVAEKVLGRLPEAHFIIAGDFGDLGHAVRAYAEAHGFSARLHMPGAVVAIGEWYRAMDLLLLTSDREGLPNVNIEAQHFGVPVVSSDVGGAPETVQPGVTGILVPPAASADAFADQIVAVLQNPEWRRLAAARGPEFVHRAFGTQQALDRLHAFYQLT